MEPKLQRIFDNSKPVNLVKDFSKQEVNALNNDFSNFPRKFFLTFDNSNYYLASTLSENIKIRCFDSCYNKTKICSVLTKFEEQENLLITLILKIENPEFKKKNTLKNSRKP